jgi:uroporphyrinogen-III synthase
VRKILYLGLELPTQPLEGMVIHYPIIKILPRHADDPAIGTVFAGFLDYTHVILSSKVAIQLFMQYLEAFAIARSAVTAKSFIAVGKASGGLLAQYGIKAQWPKASETSEGIVQLLEASDISRAHPLWLHSALSRPVIGDFCRCHATAFTDCVAYETVAHCPEPYPDLSLCDEIVFTSPSTVEAFFMHFGPPPPHATVRCIGPVTLAALQAKADYLPSPPRLLPGFMPQL